ncbi:MAG: IS66 family transposase [Roseiflexaceae bacterium]|nr:IS66 family transposase [Roseiflexaceae bacterium]
MHDEPFNLLGISDDDWANTPVAVRHALYSILEIVQAQSAQIKALQTQVRDLEAKLGQTSRNSSKPPSSDPPSAPPKPARVPRGRKAGGQPGHEGHQRPLVPPERVDEVIELRPTACDRCQTVLAADLPLTQTPRCTQVWELPPIQPYITEYWQHTVCCPHCHEPVTADLPADAPPGAFGSRATALMAILRGRYRLSLDDAAEFLSDVCQLPLSTASIVTSCERASAALAPVDTAIQATVQAAPHLNADETPWPTETRRGWLWVAVSTLATCFRIHASRGKAGLQQVLGDAYRGIVGSDRYLVYDQFPDGHRQVCWAHLVRNIVGLRDRYGGETLWAQALLTLTDDLFLVWHLHKDDWIDHVALQQALLPVRLAMQERLQAGVDSPHAKIASFSREVLAHWDALWTFSRLEGIEPTNNAAERALRHAVLWRKGCFGSRSDAGCRFVERVLSVQATCKQQQRSFFGFVTEAIQAAWAATPTPILVAPLAVAEPLSTP